MKNGACHARRWDEVLTGRHGHNNWTVCMCAVPPDPGGGATRLRMMSAYCSPGQDLCMIYSFEYET